MRILAALLLLLSLAHPIPAGTLDTVKIGLHIQQYAKGSLCEQAATEFGCNAYTFGYDSDVEVNGQIGEPYIVFLVILDIDPQVGLGSLTCGLHYASEGLGTGGLQVFGEGLCADQITPSTSPDPVWPDHGSGAVFNWDTINNCQNTIDPTDPNNEAAAVAYAFYVYAYSPDLMAVAPRTYLAEPDLTVSDCSDEATNVMGVFNYPCVTGKAGFGMFGLQPCIGFLVSTEQTTWGGIKNLFWEPGADSQ